MTGRWHADDRPQVDDSHAKGQWQADDRQIMMGDDNQKPPEYKPSSSNSRHWTGSLCTSSEGRARQSPHSRCWNRWTWMRDMNVVRLVNLILGCLPTVGSLFFQRLFSVTNYKKDYFYYYIVVSQSQRFCWYVNPMIFGSSKLSLKKISSNTKKNAILWTSNKRTSKCK